MKKFNKIYKVSFEGAVDFINNFELTAKQFNEMKKQLDKQYNECRLDEGEEDAYTITYDYKEVKLEHQTIYYYNYINGCSRVSLSCAMCEDGYVFKK